MHAIHQRRAGFQLFHRNLVKAARGAQRLDLRRNSARAFRVVAVGESDVIPFARQFQRNAHANAARSPCDQGHLFVAHKWTPPSSYPDCRRAAGMLLSFDARKRIIVHNILLEDAEKDDGWNDREERSAELIQHIGALARLHEELDHNGFVPGVL